MKNPYTLEFHFMYRFDTKTDLETATKLLNSKKFKSYEYFEEAMHEANIDFAYHVDFEETI